MCRRSWTLLLSREDRERLGCSPCSRNARPRKALVGRAQLRAPQPLRPMNDLRTGIKKMLASAHLWLERAKNLASSRDNTFEYSRARQTF